jgi:hypothetical protein
VYKLVEAARLLIRLEVGDSVTARSVLVVGGSLLLRILADLTVIVC